MNPTGICALCMFQFSPNLQCQAGGRDTGVSAMFPKHVLKKHKGKGVSHILPYLVATDSRQQCLSPLQGQEPVLSKDASEVM